jgi:uncharacterized protein YndB with AHSA1/START domain
METKEHKNNILKGHKLVIIRNFNATPEQVFHAWTTPEILMKWWGPKDFTAPFCKVDLREDREYFYCMRSPEGVDYFSKGTFKEIHPPKRIIATDSFCDANGNLILASSVGLPGNWPSTLLITVTFENDGDGTKFTLTHEGLPEEMIESCRAGWNESLDKLANTF